MTRPIAEPGMTMLHDAGEVHLPGRDRDTHTLGEACATGRFDVAAAQLTDLFDGRLLSRAGIRGVSNYAVGFDNVDILAGCCPSLILPMLPSSVLPMIWV